MRFSPSESAGKMASNPLMLILPTVFRRLDCKPRSPSRWVFRHSGYGAIFRVEVLPGKVSSALSFLACLLLTTLFFQPPSSRPVLLFGVLALPATTHIALSVKSAEASLGRLFSSVTPLHSPHVRSGSNCSQSTYTRAKLMGPSFDPHVTDLP